MVRDNFKFEVLVLSVVAESGNAKSIDNTRVSNCRIIGIIGVSSSRTIPPFTSLMIKWSTRKI